jgi:hypothetical protein
MYDPSHCERERIARLKTLASQLERLPQSSARDRLIREAHHRTVALDTGIPASSCWREQPEKDPGVLFQHMTLRPVAGFR